MYALCDYAKVTVEIKPYRSANTCWSVLMMTSFPPSLKPHHRPISTFSNAADSLGAHVPSPSAPHSSDLDCLCLLNLLLSYSRTILRPPFKASSILICCPPLLFLLPALMWNSGRWYTCQWGCGQKAFSLHVGLNPSPYCCTDMQVERVEKEGLVLLAVCVDGWLGLCSWTVSKPQLDSRTMK